MGRSSSSSPSERSKRKYPRGKRKRTSSLSSSSSSNSRSSRSGSPHPRRRSRSNTSRSQSRSSSRSRSRSQSLSRNSSKKLHNYSHGRGRSSSRERSPLRPRSPVLNRLTELQSSNNSSLFPRMSIEDQLILLREQTQLRLNCVFTHPHSQLLPIPPLLLNEELSQLLPKSRRPSGFSDLRELFVGNIPSVISQKEFVEFLENAMRHGGLSSGRQPSIQNAKITGHLLNKFAFVEFSTAQDATNALNLDSIPLCGNNLQFRRPTKYQGPNIPHTTWPRLIISQAQHLQNLILSGQTSITPLMLNEIIYPPESTDMQAVEYRELLVYIGDSTSDMTEAILATFIWNALQRMCMTVKPINPLLQCKFQSKFAFLEFRTSQEAANCLNLNGIPFMGQALKIFRPTSYAGPPITYYSWNELSSQWVDGTLKLLLSGIPSQVLQLSNLISDTRTDNGNSNIFEEIIWDINNECEQYGEIVSIKYEKSDNNFYVHMQNIESAKQALLGLKGRTYDSKIINAKFYPLDQFLAGQFLEIPPVILSTSGLLSLREIIGLPSKPASSSSFPTESPTGFQGNLLPPNIISQSGW